MASAGWIHRAAGRSYRELGQRLPRRLWQGWRLRYLLRPQGLQPLGDRRVSWRRRWNYLLCLVSARLGLARSLGRPIHVTIEPTNACDQRCPICETGLGILGRQKKMLKLDHYRAILEQFDGSMEQVFLYFMGEPFLNKDIYDMIRVAVDKGIHVSLCTDGNFVDPERLIDSGISEIHFQIGGMTQEVHEVYRVGGKLEKALAAMEEAIRIQNKKPVEERKTRICCGLILQKHNEHQIDDFLEYCERVGVDQANVIPTCLRHHSEGETYLPSDRDYWLYDEAAYARGQLVPKWRPDNYCGWIYSTMTIHVNGDAVPCCRDPKGQYVLGNVIRDGVDAVWNGPKYRELRRRVSSSSNDYGLCALCPGEDMAPLGLGRVPRD